ncbi:hypothetical protein PFZ49_02645 [Microbacterium lacticum]|uniref:hypothetical protein n=1 Tax=Microbacterium lacticum TaxID=33885 RepID=UPI003A8C5785
MIVALAAVVLTIVGGVAGAVLGALAATDAGDLVRDAAIAGAGQVLPAAVFVGLTALVFVWAPRLTIALGWMLVMLAAAIGLFGPLFGMEPGSTGSRRSPRRSHRQRAVWTSAGSGGFCRRPLRSSRGRSR